MRTRRRESRESWGFKHFPTALGSCGLRIDANEPFDPVTSTFILEGMPGPEGQLVELSLDLNAASLAAQSGLRLSDLELVLIYSNAESRRIAPLWRTGAAGHPRKWAGRISTETLSPRRYELTLQLSLIRDREQELGKVWRRGSVVAGRTWVVTNPKSSSLFSVDWTSFSERPGWDRDAMWHVEFMSSDGFDSFSPEEVVQLHINKDLEALRTLFLPSARRSPRLGPITAVLVPMVLAGVTTEIMGRVLRWAYPLVAEGDLDLDDVDEKSLVARVLHAANSMGLHPADAIRLATEEPEKLVMLVQGRFKIGRSLDSGALDRMRRP